MAIVYGHGFIVPHKRHVMFTNNFLKVHFKLKLLFFPLRKNTCVFLHQFFES